MAIPLADNIRVGAGKPSEPKYLNNLNAPYTASTQVFSQVPVGERHVGLTVNINKSDYWFKEGTANGDLVLKQSVSGGSVSGATNGLNNNHNAIELGGELTKATTIDTLFFPFDISSNGAPLISVNSLPSGNATMIRDTSGNGIISLDNGQLSLTTSGAIAIISPLMIADVEEIIVNAPQMNLRGVVRIESGELGISDYSDITLGNGGITTQFYSGDLSNTYSYNSGQNFIVNGINEIDFQSAKGSIQIKDSIFRFGSPSLYLEGYPALSAATFYGGELAYGNIFQPSSSGALTPKHYVDARTNVGNGLSKIGNRTVLGGGLTGATTISTTSTARLNIAGYPINYTTNMNSFFGPRTLIDKGYVTGITTTLQPKLVQFNRRALSYTLVLSDAGKIIETNLSTGNTVTVPPNSTVPYDIGTSIYIVQYNAGQTSITAGAGVTIRSASNKYKTNVRYSMATLIKVDTDEWYLTGDLTT